MVCCATGVIRVCERPGHPQLAGRHLIKDGGVFYRRRRPRESIARQKRGRRSAGKSSIQTYYCLSRPSTRHVPSARRAKTAAPVNAADNIDQSAIRAKWTINQLSIWIDLRTG